MILYWHWLSDSAEKFASSKVFETVVAGGLGAFAAALGAQFAINRSQTRQAVVRELNNINGALELCFYLCNKYLTLKKQHVQTIHDTYEATAREFDRFVGTRPDHRSVFALHGDLRNLAPMTPPAEMLSRLNFEKISIRGRGPLAAMQLIGAMHSLDRSFKDRDNLIMEIKDGKTKMSPEFYFGLPTPQGADDRFRSNITAIYQQTDDCIFFSRILAEDLFDYASTQRKRHRWRFIRKLPHPSTTDWSPAEKARLFPKAQAYDSFLTGFTKRQTRFQRLRARIVARLKSRSGRPAEK